LYVGEADNLNNQVEFQSLQHRKFGNPKRKSEPERNFLKRFIAVGYLTDPKVLLIEEEVVCRDYKADIHSPQLTTILEYFHIWYIRKRLWPLK